MRERVTVPREEQAKFMRAAITEAKKAALLNEVPIGAVVTYQGKIIGQHPSRGTFPLARNTVSGSGFYRICTSVGGEES